MTSAKQIIIAEHGIITGETNGWQRGLAVYADAQGGIPVIEREYFEGPTPILNVFCKNRFVAKELVELALPYLAAGIQVSFVSHSNGGDIVLKTLIRLGAWRESLSDSDRARTARVHAAIFIASVIKADVQSNGLGHLIEAGHLDRAVAYYSPNDEVLELPCIWPYEHCGVTGFTRQNLEVFSAEFDSGAISSRKFPGYGHGSYFYTDHEKETFKQILEDCA